jgi:hypothetical protein
MDRGIAVPTRILITLAASGLLAGCANYELTPSGLGMPASAAEVMVPEVMPKKTMSDRVLAAMALERITGLKPDPARLTHE